MANKIFQYKGENITFEFSDGQRMVNATQMGKPFRKKVNGFLRLNSTKDYIILLEARYADSRNEHIFLSFTTSKKVDVLN